MNLESELKEMLKNIPGAYDDFVRGIMRFCKEYNIYQEQIDFIKKCDDVTPSKVIEFQADFEDERMKLKYRE